MKRNKLFSLGLALVFVALLTLTLVSGTYAKYTSTYEGTATANIAKWSWEIDDTAAAANFKVDLFKTVLDTVNGETDQDVKTGLIAPGTKGSFQLKVTNKSEVSGKVVVVLTYDETLPTGFTFKAAGANASKWTVTEDKAAKTVTFELKDKLAVPTLEAGLSETLELAWEWVFDTETNDGANDLNDLSFAGKSLTVKVKATFTQVD